MSRSVSAWLRDGQRRLQAEDFVQADLDELLGELPDYPAQVAMDVFRTVCSQAQPPSIPMLVFPLPATQRLITKPPSFARLLARRRDSIAVPGIYLTRSSLWASVDLVEEYRVPVIEDVRALHGFSCYYRAHRSLEERRRSWEFTRGFYIRLKE